MKKIILKNLISVANLLDEAGLKKEADFIDSALSAFAKNDGYSNADTQKVAQTLNDEYDLYVETQRLIKDEIEPQHLAHELENLFTAYTQKKTEALEIDMDNVNWLEIAKDELGGNDN